ncbi:MAG: YfhO family protein [Clostridiales bacterium]|nr:YfhO family protein [Clostridiales bacterium]
MRELRKDSRISFSEMRTKAGLLLSFFLPMILLLLVAYKFKIYPFSKDCLITDTLRDTYIPVISEWRRKAVNHETLFYTWNAGGGVNFWAWVSSYAMSPFVLLYLLFPAEKIAQATQLIFAIKVCFASLSLFVLLWKKENVVSPVSVALSVSYSLCSYVLTYSQEPWILDTVILLPLLVLSMYYLIRGTAPWMFAILVALTGITCAKAGSYMLMFVLLMFPLLIMESYHEGPKPRKLLRVIRDFFIFLFLGIGMSAFVWLPSAFAFGKTVYGGQMLHVPEDLTMDLKAWDILERACFDPLLVFPADETQSPAIYCGIFPIILVFLYGFSPRIRFSEKVYHFSAIVCIYITMSSKIIQFVAQGFHFPVSGQFPHSILITFLIVYMAGRILAKPSWFDDRSHVWGTCGIIITFMLIRSAVSKTLDYADFAVFVAIAFFIFYIAMVFCFSSFREKHRNLILSALAVVMLLESGLSFYRPIKERYYHAVLKAPVVEKNTLESLRISPNGVGKETEETQKKKKVYALDSAVLYQGEDKEMVTLLKTGDSGISKGGRILAPNEKKSNYGLLFGYPTFSADSYLLPKSLPKMLRALGVNTAKGDSEIRLGTGTEVTDILLSSDLLVSEEFGKKDIKEIPNTKTNSFFFSFEDVYDDILTSDSPFENQNALALRFARVEPLKTLHMDVIEFENMKTDDEGNMSAMEQDARMEVLLQSQEILSSNNTPIYIYYTCEQDAAVEVSFSDDNGQTNPYRRSESSSTMIKIDEKDTEGMRVNVKLTLYAPRDSKLQLYVAALDTDLMTRFEETIREGAWNLTSISAGEMSGTIDSSYPGNLAWNIPSDPGWSAQIDGQKTETFSAYGSFLAIHVPSGQHDVTLRFVPQGYDPGKWISISSLAITVAVAAGIEILRRTKRKEEVDA